MSVHKTDRAWPGIPMWYLQMQRDLSEPIVRQPSGMADDDEYGERVKFSDLRSSEKDEVIEVLLDRLGLDILRSEYERTQVSLVPKRTGA